MAKIPSQTVGSVKLVLEAAGKQVLSVSNPKALQEAVMGESVALTFDTAAMGGAPVTVAIEGKFRTLWTGDEITLGTGTGWPDSGAGFLTRPDSVGSEDTKA